MVPKSEKPAPENVRLVYVTLGRDGSYAQVQDKNGLWHEVTISEASEIIGPPGLMPWRGK